VSDFIQLILIATIIIAPMIAYHSMIRRRDRTRGQLILGTMLAAAGPALLAAALAALIAGWPTMDLLPWVLVASAYGTIVGVLGLLARFVGAWLAGREP
jgi:hypothetical protein